MIAGQAGAFASIGFWSIAATVLLAAVLISSLTELNFFGLFLSAALLYLIYQHPFHLIIFSFWQLVLAAVFASIGFSMIFHSRYHHRWYRHGRCGWAGESDQKIEETIDGSDIFIKTNFSESCKYPRSDDLRSARLASSFGKLSVFFDQVQLNPEGAEARVDVSFGEMILYVPKTWRVIDHVHAAFGAVNSQIGTAPSDAGAPTLTLTGSVSFGNLIIRYA